ncbi:MAG: helix-turn-helix domain-containing protein [Pseudonocardiaceae bacterium]
MTPPIPQRTRLAARLKELRAGKFRSGNQFAAHVGWPQPRVSKIETGAQRPSAQDISTWVNAVDEGPEVEAELLAMLAACPRSPARMSEVVCTPGSVIDVGTRGCPRPPTEAGRLLADGS